MGAGRDIVITAYGHDKTIDKIAVSTFDTLADAATYCNKLNKLESNGNAWVFSKIISEKKQYAVDSFLPLKGLEVKNVKDPNRTTKISTELVDYTDEEIAFFEGKSVPGEFIL